MTSDDELLKLETAAIQSIDGELRGPALKAAARIRELEVEIKTFQEMQMQSDRNQSRMVDRIYELEAELDALKSDLSGYMDAANTYVNELHGVHAGTHTIVPVEPTDAILRAAHGFMSRERWQAMLRAAQPGASD